MKNVTAILLASLTIGQAALAGTLTCDVTRTNKYNENDVSTQKVSMEFDENCGRHTLISQSLNTFLVPWASGHLNVGLEVINRGRGTRLALETVNTYGNQIVFDEKIGSLISAPDTVTNKFEVGDYSMEVDCYIEQGGDAGLNFSGND